MLKLYEKSNRSRRHQCVQLVNDETVKFVRDLLENMIFSMTIIQNAQKELHILYIIFDHFASGKTLFLNYATHTHIHVVSIR